MNYTAMDVWYRVEELKRRNARHRKRGFRINDIGVLMQSSHLAEEVIELQAEVINAAEVVGGAAVDPARPADASMLTEAGHVMAVFVHLCMKLGLPLADVCASAIAACDKHWTTNESEVTAPAPGQTRGARREDFGYRGAPPLRPDGGGRSA